MFGSHQALAAACAFASVVNVAILSALLSRPAVPRLAPRSSNYCAFWA